MPPFCDSIELGGREMPWLIIDLSTDTTPLRVQFGHMLKELAQAARYWHWCSASRTWSLLSSCDYRQAAGMLPKYGILETLAQTVQIIYPSKCGSFVQVRRRKLRSPTCFLQNSTGSNMLAALEASPAALSIANLLKLARTGLKFIFLAIGADLAASNGRMKCEVARRLHAHNGRHQCRWCRAHGGRPVLRAHIAPRGRVSLFNIGVDTQAVRGGFFNVVARRLQWHRSELGSCGSRRLGFVFPATTSSPKH